MPKKKKIAKSKKPRASSAARSSRRSPRQRARHAIRKAGRKQPPKRTQRRPTKPVKSPRAKASKPVRRKGARGTTAAEILSLAKVPAAQPKAKHIPTRWISHYRNLLRLREELLIQSGQLARDAHEEGVRHSMHMADSGTDSFDRDFALSLLSADQQAIREIEEAVKRIENGTYGICELTGKPIGKARLEAIPWTRFSYEAQSRLEREGIVNHTHLGSLGSIYTSDNWETSNGEEEEEEQASPEKATGDGR